MKSEKAALNGLSTPREKVVAAIREWMTDDWFDVDELADAVLATLGLT